MSNAKHEFLDHTRKKPRIKCVKLKDIRNCDNSGSYIVLKLNYTDKDFLEFLDKIDYIYSEDFGSQELLGNIWYTDGTWSKRGEYDGSEWWEYMSCPDIPDDLK